MALPDPLDLWASASTYAGSGGPTKAALSAGRLAEGYVPLAHAIAAQEANEYLHRVGTVIDQHRDNLAELVSRVPGYVNSADVMLQLTPYPDQAAGAFEWQNGIINVPETPFGIRTLSGTVHFHAQIACVGYLERLSLYILGEGSDPGSGRPNMQVVAGRLQYWETLAQAGADYGVQNLAAQWDRIHPLDYVPATRPSCSTGLIVDCSLTVGSGVTALVCGLIATISPDAS